MTDPTTQYDWERDIAPYLQTMQTVNGGFTPAQRGVVTIHDSTKVFVKIAVDTMTAKWLKKEIKVYSLLNDAGYPSVPKILAHNDDKTAMAIEYLEDAQFDAHWDEQKLDAVMNAQQILKQYKDVFSNDDDFAFYETRTTLETKWQRILIQENLTILNGKLAKFQLNTKLTLQKLTDLHATLKDWTIKQDTLIHEDIRADNFGYLPNQPTSKLVDWNWLVIGDESLDMTSLFVNVYGTGFDPYLIHPEKYDPKMLAYLVCFWLDSILIGDEDSSERAFRLRASQAKSVANCLELLDKTYV